jgi:hypothetical protein
MYRMSISCSDVSSFLKKIVTQIVLPIGELIDETTDGRTKNRANEWTCAVNHHWGVQFMSPEQVPNCSTGDTEESATG